VHDDSKQLLEPVRICGLKDIMEGIDSNNLNKSRAENYTILHFTN